MTPPPTVTRSGASVPAVAERFTQEELEALRDRAFSLAQEQEQDASLRAALQLLAEAAGNVAPKVASAPAPPDA
jgi:hypothetical protein